MKRELVAAIDQGTTGTRFTIYAADGTIVARRYEAHQQLRPRPGWVEHDPLEIWHRTERVITATLAGAHVDARAIAALGVTKQRETTVLWDVHTGQPCYNAIVWQCTRTRTLCDALIRQGVASEIREKTGLPVHTYFSGPKIQWIMNAAPETRARAERGDVVFGTMDSWLIWNLTGGPAGGVHATDYTNASRTLLMHLRRLDWDDGLLAVLDVPRAMLPSIRPSSSPSAYGVTDAAGVFHAEIPVCGVIGDQQAALIGQACFAQGDVKNTYGTGCFLLMNTGDAIVPSTHGLLTTCAYGFEGQPCRYALEGSVAMAGATVRWLRDNLGLITAASETETLARTVSTERSAGTYFVPAFSGLFAPYWDMSARGCIVGLTEYTRREHLVHAALEAIGYQTRDVLEAMVKDAAVPVTAIKADGGASSNGYLLQLQADILGVPVLRPRDLETTSRGAAHAAAVAVGVWDDAVVSKRAAVHRTFTPRWSRVEREERYAGWRRAVERSRGWVGPRATPRE
jgi:glycerol kinase